VEQRPNVRSYRLSTACAEQVLGFRPQRTMRDTVLTLVSRARAAGIEDFDDPRYYNIEGDEALPGRGADALGGRGPL